MQVSNVCINSELQTNILSGTINFWQFTKKKVRFKWNMFSCSRKQSKYLYFGMGWGTTTSPSSPKLGRPLHTLESNTIFRVEKQEHPKGPPEVAGANCRSEQTQGFVPFVVCMSQFCCEKVTKGLKQRVHRLFGFFSDLARDFLLPNHSVFEHGAWGGRLVPCYLWDCLSNSLNRLWVKT